LAAAAVPGSTRSSRQVPKDGKGRSNSAAKKTGQIAVVGFDALSEARDAIRQGSMVATVAQSPDRMGAMAVENAVKLLKGEQVNAEFVVPIKLVTKENAGQ
jgi:ribose transport system substrate-binding protein